MVATPRARVNRVPWCRDVMARCDRCAGLALGSGWPSLAVALRHSSISGPKASVPPAPNSAAKTSEHPDPGPALVDRRTTGAERRFRRPGCTDQDRRHHREQQQREQCLAAPAPAARPP